MPIIFAILLTAGAVAAGSLSAQQSIESNGIARTFYYYAPDNYDPAQGSIFYLHGGGGNGLAAAGASTDNLWQSLADRVGVLTLFPEGKQYNSDPTSRTWNDCSDDTRSGCETCTDYDDVQFIRDLITWVSTSYDANIDLTRMYAAGESKGALMSERLALEANDVIAAVASVSGNLPVSNDNSGSYKCAGYDAPYTAGTSEAVPILLFKGDADPRIPFGSTVPGGTDHNYYPLYSDYCYRPAYGICPPLGGYCVNGCVHSFWDSLAFWEWKHNISPSPSRRVPATQTIHYADTIPDCNSSCPDCDGSYVIRHNIGTSPYRVVLDRAVGGGHHFPGPSADTPDCTIYDKLGWKNRDTLGSLTGYPYLAEEIWAFFSQFTLDD